VCKCDKIFPVSLDWRKAPEMPLAIGGDIQAVEVDGTLYVGGGSTGSNDDDCVVMAYDTRSNQWRSLPPYNAINFSMAVINSKVVLVGGYYGGSIYSRELGVLQANDRSWTQPFPPLPTGRSRASSADW